MRKPTVREFRLARRAACVVLLLALPACIYDGAYVVRGNVTARRGEAVEPVADASVRVLARDDRSGGSRPARTNAAGRFEVEYQFGGVGFLLRPGDGDPVVELTASGFRRCTLPLRDPAPRSGVTRRACDANAPRCFELDVLLERDSAPSSGTACP